MVRRGYAFLDFRHAAGAIKKNEAFFPEAGTATPFFPAAANVLPGLRFAQVRDHVVAAPHLLPSGSALRGVARVWRLLRSQIALHAAPDRGEIRERVELLSRARSAAIGNRPCHLLPDTVVQRA